MAGGLTRANGVGWRAIALHLLTSVMLCVGGEGGDETHRSDDEGCWDRRNEEAGASMNFPLMSRSRPRIALPYLYSSGSNEVMSCVFHASSPLHYSYPSVSISDNISTRQSPIYV